MKGAPFTRLCRAVAKTTTPARADLHTHTTFSDGTHTPADVVARAVKAGLAALAVTDHDTMAGFAPAEQAAPPGLEVIPGVEITCEFRGAELHLLGYFVDSSEPRLSAALADLRASRRERALEMARRLKRLGASIQDDVERLSLDIAVGRRHLGRFLVERGVCGTLHSAFTRWLAAPDVAAVPKRRLPVADAIALVRGAGGVASWAHPPIGTDEATLRELRELGLAAVESEYPWPTGAHGKRLRAMADALGLAITGGSDSHDPGPGARAVGAKSVSMDVVDRIRGMATPRLPAATSPE